MRHNALEVLVRALSSIGDLPEPASTERAGMVPNATYVHEVRHVSLRGRPHHGNDLQHDPAKL
eukprot:5216424-Pleurochrysis_carterae.AAC.1